MPSLTVTCPHCGWNHWYLVGHTQCYNCGRLLTAMPTHKFRSQKLRGMGCLSQVAYYLPLAHTLCDMKTLPVLATVQDKEGIKAAFAACKGSLPSPGVFARPCPVQPRHGFVESRVISTEEELSQLWEETIQADPEGEIMLTPLINAEFNAIWTPSLYTIGRGRDGATSGRDTLLIPLVRGKGCSRAAVEEGGDDLTLRTLAGIADEEDPYIEMVSAQNQRFITQLRAGKRMEGSGRDFIPSEMAVEEVITVNPSSSLLAWEELIGTLKGKPGVVVNNVGGSPADHFSVHARCANIPVITTRKVEVGETLTPIETIPLSRDSIFSGIVVGEHLPFDREVAEQAICLLLFALHNSAAFEGDDGFWVGVGISFLLRLGTTALKGEARHIKNIENRESLYTKAFKFGLSRHRALVPALTHILRYGNFRSSAVGGYPWALCGQSIIDLFNALTRFMQGGEIGELIQAYNQAIHQAHNGGWWLNKFAYAHLFNSAAQLHPAFPIFLTPLFVRLRELEKVLMYNGTIQAQIKRYAKWTIIKPFAPPIIKATFDCIPGMAHATVSIQDKVLRTNHRAIVVPTEKVVEAIFSLGGDIYATNGENGLKLELRKKRAKPIVLWEDKPLQGSHLKKG